MRRKTIRPGLMGISLLAGLAAQPALAQDAAAPAAPAPSVDAPDVATIVVTGSRIARLRSDAIAPTQVVSGAVLERSGDVLIEEHFKRLPAFSFTSPGASSPIGPQSGPFGSGQTFLDYLSLGSQRTLVLIDSHRSVSSSSASVFGAGDPGSQVDINTIPTLMIDRIETVSIGGAPIYGSDAIAGTVNIVLKDHFHGVKLDGEAGFSGHGDASQYRLGVLAGTDFAGGRGSVVASFEYTDSDGLLATDRAVTRDAPGYLPPVTGTSAFKNVYVPNMRLTVVSDYGIPVISLATLPGLLKPFDIRTPPVIGQALAFNANGQLAPFDYGTASGVPFAYAGGMGFNQATVTSLLTPLRRYVGYAKARYEVSDGITAHLSTSYANSRGTTLRTDPAYNGSAALFTAVNNYLAIPLSNPFLSAADRATISAAITAATRNPSPTTFFLARANTDVVSGLAVSTTELFRVSGSLDGDFALAGRKWHWDVSSSYGRVTNTGTGRQILEQNFQNALGGCLGASSPIASINPTCSPFNPFGQTNSQATLDYVAANYTARSVNTQWVGTASARGSLFDLPGGPAEAVIGYEHRYEHAQFDPDAYMFGKVLNPADPTAARQSYGRNAPVDPVRGHFHTNEVFGELRLPFASIAEVNAAGRYVDHSLAGGAFTWTAGAKFRPVPDVTLRGNFTRSIRSPAVTELFNPTSQSFLTGNDPCDARFIGGGLVPTIRKANCVAAGAPANLTSTLVSPGVLGTTAGNPALRNEVADSWTIGAVLAPRFVPGLSVSVDWLDIKLKDAIVSLSARQVLEACYDSTNYPAAATCGQFTRNATTGQITTIRTGFLNVASTRYSGLAVDGNWRIDAPFLGPKGRVTLDAQYQYTDTLETRVAELAITHLAGAIGNSRHKATGTLAFDNASVGSWVRVNYIGPAVIDMDAAAGTYDTPHRDAVAFVDAGAHFTVADKFTLRISVENVFDTKPPFPSPAGGGVIAYWQGVMGRYFKVGASAAF